MRTFGGRKSVGPVLGIAIIEPLRFEMAVSVLESPGYEPGLAPP
jgi:hypothetical protein